MTHRTLPSVQALNAPHGTWEAPTSAYDRWAPVRAAASDDANTINIYDQIGESWDGSGMTAKIVNSVLRKAKGDDITVNVNSPGGDFFEGVTIYNMLREYEGSININVIGLAASAASIVAMAADDLKIAKSGFLMIHNSWGLVIGNQHDMREAADTFAVFDESMAHVYTDRSNLKLDAIKSMMDSDTWMSGEKAVDDGFADGFLKSDEVVEDTKKARSSVNKLDVALAKTGMPRSERREIIKDLTSGTPSAADATPSAGSPELYEALSKLKNTLKENQL